MYQERSEVIQRRLEKLGLTFQQIPHNLTSKVMDFLWDNFFQQEPLTSSMNLDRTWIIDNLRYIPLLKKGDSYVVLIRTGEIVGVRIGRQMDIHDKVSQFLDIVGPTIMINGSKLAGSKADFSKIIILKNILKYDPWKFMTDHNCQKIFEALIVCVDKKYRGEGIGEILMHNVNKIVKESGCEYTYGLYTSDYSSAINQNLGNGEVLSSAKYNELVDKHGNLLLPKYEEHTIVSAMDFLWEHFFHNEPLSTSINVKRSWIMDNLRFIPIIKKGESFVALDRNGEIVGVYLGRQMDIKHIRKEKLLDLIGPTLIKYGLLLTGATADFSKIIWLKNHLNYDPWKFMTDNQCQRIYENIILAVDKKWRGNGIGEMMMQDVNKSVKSAGCEYTYGLYTSKFSTALSVNMGNEKVLSSAAYKDLLDSDGKLIFPLYKEHTIVSVRICKL